LGGDLRTYRGITALPTGTHFHVYYVKTAELPSYLSTCIYLGMKNAAKQRTTTSTRVGFCRVLRGLDGRLRLDRKVIFCTWETNQILTCIPITRYNVDDNHQGTGINKTCSGNGKRRSTMETQVSTRSQCTCVYSVKMYSVRT